MVNMSTDQTFLLLLLGLLVIMSNYGHFSSALRMPPIVVDVKKRQADAEINCSECKVRCIRLD